MPANIIFIHGMFQNSKSWKLWAEFFRNRGYGCIVESWPLHDGEPAQLRESPPSGLADLGLQSIIDKFADMSYAMSSPPIVIGHSVGGLITQKLNEMGLISMGVPISSVAPNRMLSFDSNRMLSFDWNFFKNSLTIANPLLGDSIFELTEDGFHESFANTLSKELSRKAYEATVTYDSRNILRDCMLEAGTVDFEKCKAPLLFVSGEKDKIIPAKLCQKNSEAYKNCKTNYISFKNRDHYICCEPGWEKVAVAVEKWIAMQILQDDFEPKRTQNFGEVRENI
jgi:esterase/lipase